MRSPPATIERPLSQERLGLERLSLRRFSVQLAGLLAAGAALRLALVAAAPGEYYDPHAIAHVGAAFLNAPLHLYGLDGNPGSYQGSPT